MHFLLPNFGFLPPNFGFNVKPDKRLARPRRLKLVDTGRTESIIHIHKYNKKYPVTSALATYKKGKYRNHKMIADYISNYGTKKGVHITETKVYTHEVVRPRNRVRSSTADRRRNKLQSSR